MPTQQTATHTQNVMTTSQQNASMPSQPISAPISTPTQSVGTQQLVQPAVTSQPQCTPQQTATQHVVEKTAAPPETVHHATILTYFMIFTTLQGLMISDRFIGQLAKSKV
eukprot:529542_1